MHISIRALHIKSGLLCALVELEEALLHLTELLFINLALPRRAQDGRLFLDHLPLVVHRPHHLTKNHVWIFNHARAANALKQ